MKRIFVSLLISTISIWIVRCANAQESALRNEDTDPYLSRTPTGEESLVFAPGVVSVDGTNERSLALSPNEDEMFYAHGTGWPNMKIMRMVKKDGAWSMPEAAAFLKNGNATQPVFSPDGKYLYFSSNYGRSDVTDYSIWRTKKEKGEWSDPENIIDMGGQPFMEFHPTVTRDYTVYFLYWDFAKQIGDIYVSKLVGDRYVQPVIVGPPVSTEYDEVRPTVHPDGRFLLFESNRPGGYGDTDIYIAYHNDDGTWSPAKNLGPFVNTASLDDTPNFSPDGKYWFYCFNRDIYWRKAPALPVK